VWTGLWIVYVVWGSTYLAIRIMVETVPPLLGAGARFAVAGAVMVAVLAVRRGLAAVRPTRAQVLSALAVGILLPGANAVITVAEHEVPSNVAALLVGSIPLWVILLRTVAGESVSRRSIAAVLVGFALETETGESLINAARGKLAKKRVDMVVANHAADSFGKDDNRATIVTRADAEAFGVMPKAELADRILDRVLALCRP